jgi:hypothetical protein
VRRSKVNGLHTRIHAARAAFLATSSDAPRARAMRCRWQRLARRPVAARHLKMLDEPPRVRWAASERIREWGQAVARWGELHFTLTPFLLM